MPKRICLHWTAGTHDATDFEKQFYHYLVDGEGTVHDGIFKPLDNDPPPWGSLKSGRYAAHCGGGNSHAIGIGICGMHGYIDKRRPGKFPLTRKSFEAACKLTAELCLQYRIPVSEATVYSHAAFGRKNPRTSSAGKIDINVLPWVNYLSPDAIEDYIREKVNWYLQRLKENPNV